uniref:hypothetical protein n=1 Tax=Trichocoleus desertorum TaxID=1481672 RepID=UPI0025B47510|nr:hypothetical protein [Trichocoleus desertorum]
MEKGLDALEKQRFRLIWTVLLSMGCTQLLFRLTHINALLPIAGSEFVSLLLLDLLFVAFLSVWPAYLRVENQGQDLRRKTIANLIQSTSLVLAITFVVTMTMALVKGSRLWPTEVCVMAIALMWFGSQAVSQFRSLPHAVQPYAWRILATISTIFFIIGSHLLYWGYPSTANFGLHVNSFEQIVKLVEQEQVQLEPLTKQSIHQGHQFLVKLSRRYQYLSPCGTVLTQENSGVRMLDFCQFGGLDGDSSFLYRSDKQDISITPEEYQRLQEASSDLPGPWYRSRTKLQDHWFWEVEEWK